MKKLTFIVTLLMLISQNSFGQKKKTNMQTIQFIPKAFHDVKLGFDENTIHALTPYYPETDDVMKNEIAINIPQKIIFTSKAGEFIPIIPLCGYFDISHRRSMKFADYDEELGEYADHFKMMIHIKKSSEEEWFSGEIIEDYEDEIPYIPEWAEKEEEERQQKIKEAQKYTLEELDDGESAALAFNINVLKYVKIHLTSDFHNVYIYIGVA